jgi:hypothetical protein
VTDVITAVANSRACLDAFLRASRRLHELSIARWWPFFLGTLVNPTVASSDDAGRVGVVQEEEEEEDDDKMADGSGGFCWPPNLRALDCNWTVLEAPDLVGLVTCCTGLRELAFGIVTDEINDQPFTFNVPAHAVNRLLGSLTRLVRCLSLWHNKSFFNKKKDFWHSGSKSEQKLSLFRMRKMFLFYVTLRENLQFYSPFAIRGKFE